MILYQYLSFYFYDVYHDDSLFILQQKTLFLPSFFCYVNF
jgi:hypothetical protein